MRIKGISFSRGSLEEGNCVFVVVPLRALRFISFNNGLIF